MLGSSIIANYKLEAGEAAGLLASVTRGSASRNKIYFFRDPKKKKILHHSSHIRLIRWTLPVSRDIGEHSEQAESTSV